MDFIQWTDNNGELSGSAQEVWTDGQAPDMEATNETFNVLGTLNGSAITLTFDRGAQVFGTMSLDGFTVDFPQNDGTLAAVTFESTSAAQYNDAVTNLDQQVDEANQVAENVEAQAQQQAAAQAQQQARGCCSRPSQGKR